MVHVETREEMGRIYYNNLEQYIEYHPGEYVLFEGSHASTISTKFFKTEKELNKATEKYRGLLGPTTLRMKIPIELPESYKLSKELPYDLGRLIKEMQSGR